MPSVISHYRQLINARVCEGSGLNVSPKASKSCLKAFSVVFTLFRDTGHLGYGDP